MFPTLCAQPRWCSRFLTWLSILDCKLLGGSLQHWWLCHHPRMNQFIVFFQCLLSFLKSSQSLKLLLTYLPKGHWAEKSPTAHIEVASFIRLYSRKSLYQNNGQLVPWATGDSKTGTSQRHLTSVGACTRKEALASRRLQDHTTHFDITTLYPSHCVHT